MCIRRSPISVFLLVASIALSSCAGSGALTPASTSAEAKVTAPACYSGDTGTPYTTSATITFYGWPDNTPPGAAIANPVIHSVAGGDGSYCNPTTFATEPTKAENAAFPYGVRIYVPFLQKYFIREDDCTNSGPSVGSGSNGCSGTWFDLWIGGDKTSKTKYVVNCENGLTPNGEVSVIIHPGSSEPVAWTGSIFNDPDSCNEPPGSATPTPEPSARPSPTPKPTHRPRK